MTKIYIASDHAGFELKKQMVEALKASGSECEIVDLGPSTADSVDYPDFADKLCKTINPQIDATNLREFGVLICGSGQGMAMRANKYPHVRAALVYNDEITALSREHNNANIICLGSRFCTPEQALKWINIFKKTAFAGGRHQTRVAKLATPIS
jgi:ribose 5-phosphate isomerase B